LLVFLVGGFLLIPFAMLGSYQSWYENESIATHNQLMVLNPGQSLMQSFTAKDDFAKSARFLVGPLSKRVKGTFEILKDMEGDIVEKGEFLIPINHNILEISFNPIESSKGNIFYIKVTANMENPVAIVFFKSKGHSENSVLYYGGAAQSESVVFQIEDAKNTSKLERWRTVIQRISQYKPIWAKGICLLFLFGSFYFLTWAWLVILLKNFNQNR